MAGEFCTQCGAPIQEGTSFCKECGTSFAVSVSDGNEHTAVSTSYFPESQPAHAGPVYDVPPPKSSRYAVLSFGGAFVSLLLMFLPVLGFFFCLVWSCGGTKNQNRRNLARAFLLLFLLLVAFGALLYYLLPSVFDWDPNAWLSSYEFWQFSGLL